MLSLACQDYAEFSLEIQSDLSELATVRSFVTRAYRELADGGLTEDDLQSVVLAATEVVTNIIRHAYGGQEGRIIRCVAAVDDDKFSFTFHHYGKPLKPPASVPQMEEPSEGGMGLYIITQCVDEVIYDQGQDGHPCIRLIKYLTKGHAMENTFERVGDVTVFEVNLEALDASTVCDFKQEIVPLIENESLLLLDLSKVEFVDSAGLGGIVSILKQLRGQGGDIKVSGLRKSVRALFELVRMHKLIDVFDDREEALQSFTT